MPASRDVMHRKRRAGARREALPATIASPARTPL
jgi:hypothetical protein